MLRSLATSSRVSSLVEIALRAPELCRYIILEYIKTYIGTFIVINIDFYVNSTMPPYCPEGISKCYMLPSFMYGVCHSNKIISRNLITNH